MDQTEKDRLAGIGRRAMRHLKATRDALHRAPSPAPMHLWSAYFLSLYRSQVLVSFFEQVEAGVDTPSVPHPFVSTELTDGSELVLKSPLNRTRAQ